MNAVQIAQGGRGGFSALLQSQEREASPRGQPILRFPPSSDAAEFELRIDAADGHQNQLEDNANSAYLSGGPNPANRPASSPRTPLSTSRDTAL